MNFTYHFFRKFTTDYYSEVENNLKRKGKENIKLTVRDKMPVISPVFMTRPK